MAHVLKKITWLGSAFLLICFYFWSARHSPESLLEALHLDVPTRYILILDAERPQFQSYDLLQADSAAQTVSLRAKPQLARLQKGQFLYAEHGAKSAYLLQLEGQREEKISVDFPLQALYMSPQEALLVGEKRFLRWDLAQQKGQTQTGKLISAHWDGAAWLLLQEDGLWRWAEEKQQLAPAHWLEASASAYSVAANALAFAFRDAEGWQAALWHLDDLRLEKTVIHQKPARPYANQAGSAFYWLSGTDLIQWRQNWQSLSAADAGQELLLAWLDKRLLRLGEKWTWHDAKSLQKLEEVGAGAVWDAFVTGNGQKVLLGQNHDLFILDAKTMRVEKRSLKNMVKPHQILMGSSYTLCH